MQLDTVSDTTLCAMNPDQHHESLGRCKTVLRAKNLEASSEPLGHTARTHSPQDNEAVVASDQRVDLAVSNQTNDDHRTEPSDSVPGPDHRPSLASSDAIKLTDTSSCAGHLDPHPWLVALGTFRKLSTKIKQRITSTAARGLKNLAEGGKVVTDPTNIAWLKNHLEPSYVDRGPHLAWPPRVDRKRLQPETGPPVKQFSSRQIGRPPNLLKGEM